MNKDAKIAEDDWKKTWKPGTYRYLDPEYKPGTHEIERGRSHLASAKDDGECKGCGEAYRRQDQAEAEEMIKGHTSWESIEWRD